MLEQLKGTVQDIHDAIGEAPRQVGGWAATCDPVTPGMRAYQAAGFQGEGRQGQAERPPKEPRSNLRRGPPRGGCLRGGAGGPR